jgi:hypothetical protein
LCFAAIWRPVHLLDYAAFVCAGQEVRLGHDPYGKIGTMLACQQRIVALNGGYLARGQILPAPFPTYVLVLFAGWSMLPQALGAALWVSAILLAYGSSVLMLRHLSGQSYAVVVAATMIPILWATLSVGELTPFILCAILAAACALRAGKPEAASCAALVAMCEPHLGFPVCLALFCCSPRARRSLLLGVCMLGLLGLTMTPPNEVLEYFLKVLPGHARAEIIGDSQLSASHALAVLGVEPSLATLLGLLQYCVMCAVGASCAVRFARRPGESDLALLAPAALVVFGGSFVHIAQIAASACCALVALRHISEQERRSIYIHPLDLGLVLLATPFILARRESQMIAYGFIAAVLLLARGYSWRHCVAASMSIFFTLSLVLRQMFLRFPYFPTQTEKDFMPSYDYGTNADIEATWHAFVAARYTWLGSVSLFAQAPTLLALAIITYMLCRRAFGRQIHLSRPPLGGESLQT